MKISQYLKKELIFLKTPYYSKKKIIEYMAKKLCEFKKISCEKEIVESVMTRERINSTGLTHGLAVPHARTDLVNKVYLVFLRCNRGVKWHSSDGKLVHYVLLVVGPSSLSKEYLLILGQISRAMMRKNVKNAIRHAKKPEEIIDAIKASGIRHHKR